MKTRNVNAVVFVIVKASQGASERLVAYPQAKFWSCCVLSVHASNDHVTFTASQMMNYKDKI